MSVDSTALLFQKLESSLRSLVGAEDISDYEKLAAYLNLAKEVHSLGEQFRNINGSFSSSCSEELPKTSFPNMSVVTNLRLQHDSKSIDSTLNPGSPIYFVYNDELIKLGIANSGGSKLYKKSVKLSEVKSIARAFLRLAGASPVVCAADIQSELKGCPLYRIQTTLLALVAAGALQQPSRGKYSLSSPSHGNSSPSDLIDSIRQLPVDERVLELINGSHC